jgi:prepilin-type N-terminal cleavage/methylation domain-containing protein
VRSDERGESLIEVVVAVAIVAIATSALGAALIAAVHHFGGDPIQAALETSVTREMRIAVDVMKYQGATLPTTSGATAIPLPTGSPLPVSYVMSSHTNAADGSVTIVLTVTDSGDASKSATLSQTIAAPAPLPGARVQGVNGNAPQ